MRFASGWLILTSVDVPRGPGGRFRRSAAADVIASASSSTLPAPAPAPTTPGGSSPGTPVISPRRARNALRSQQYLDVSVVSPILLMV